VVALGLGGAIETVTDGETGVLFPEPTVESLTAALARVSAIPFDSERIRAHTEQFSRDRHAHAMQRVIDETMAAPAEVRW
jgi:glycosyltransferase involved in cell wall biosynthesis